MTLNKYKTHAGTTGSFTCVDDLDQDGSHDAPEMQTWSRKEPLLLDAVHRDLGKQPMAASRMRL